jgi:D-arabinose 1-dehydrogenase-like Zn-dependent alcohol dehydrogenase
MGLRIVTGRLSAMIKPLHVPGHEMVGRVASVCREVEDIRFTNVAVFFCRLHVDA